MNLSYLFKMRFIVLFTYFTFLLQKRQWFVTFSLQSIKKHPTKLDFICLTFEVPFIIDILLLLTKYNILFLQYTSTILKSN